MTKRTYRPQSGFLAPLNRVLGTETNVRILRALDQIQVPIGISELSRQIEMDRAGVWRAVSVLEELGVVEGDGSGKERRLRLRRQYPLSRNLSDLFRAERVRFEKFRAELASVAANLRPPAESVWIEGPIATGGDQMGDYIHVGLLAHSKDVGRLADTFSRKVTPIQKQFDVPIEVRGLTKADISTADAKTLKSLGEAVLIAGVPPTAFIPGGPKDQRRQRSEATFHKQREEESLILAKAVAVRLRKNPSLVQRALRYVNERLRQSSPREAKELHAWRRILQTYSPARIRKFLTDEGETATRLRQSSPFMAVLLPKERLEIAQESTRLATIEPR